MAFSFGTQNKAPVFGATATTAPGLLFSGFGTTPATSSGFGSSTTTQGLTFGTATTSTTTPGFGFGGAASTPFGATGSLFGSTTPAFGVATTSAPTAAGFGVGTTTFGAGTTAFGVNPTPFGAGTTPFGAGTTGFGANTTGFGTGATGFGTATSTGTAGFGGFGGTLSAPGSTGFGTTSVPGQNVVVDLANMATAVSMPVIFGDERDAVIAKWNQLQAFWGVGKGYFNQQGQAVDFPADNPFSVFKAVGYTCMSATKNEDGLVVLFFNKKIDEVCANQQQIVDKLHNLMGSRQNLTVCVDSVKELPDDRTEMVIYVQDRAATGVMTRVSAVDVSNHLNSAGVKPILTQHLCIGNIAPKVGFKSDLLKHYLEHPPAGIDPIIWQQAKLDNPDPDKMIPVAMVGFSELHSRLKHQDNQTQAHLRCLELIAQDIAILQHKHTDMIAKTEEYKRRHMLLSHRVLQVLVKQEIYRRHGYAIQVDEEQIRGKLEAIQAELSAPTQFKGRLNELMSQMRMQNQLSTTRTDGGYRMDSTAQQEIKQHLKQQQAGLMHLFAVIKDDLSDLKLIEQGLNDISKLRR